MREARPFRPWKESPRLVEHPRRDRTELWTRTAAAPPAVYGERWSDAPGGPYRTFDPMRAKLAAAIVRGWEGDLPAERERWLYLGAASGTTASHVADLVGPDGAVYAVERSLRPFARLLALGERWPGLLPVLGDAREPRSYSALVPPADGLYADIAQPDQIAIVLSNARLLLRGAGAPVLIALKTASMGRDASAPEHLRRAEGELEPVLALERSVKLDPFHRGHYLVGGRARAALFDDGPRPRARRPPERSRGPRRS
ncbi:MAG TPA: fibrillarin-like rRNA/tRNA 2'-O-methyltransferase [Thermoplasmata archaeon]|nr:fibrillarin-like rRNA/tRNA 2'-O-methyltransferase [Thermoplasmata archaeon]